MSFAIDQRWMIPVEPGQAVDRGWKAATGHRPVAVTWHWTATWTLGRCNELLGGRDAERRGRASAHYAVGRSFEEGVARYVSLENRSWHAGLHQTLRFDGRPMTHPDEKGARTSIGVETVSIGYARRAEAGDERDVHAETDWIAADTVDGGRRLLVQPWTEEQIEMMIAVGREIVERWPGIGPRHHHGHHDLCPGYKVDVAGFPFARVLRGIYPEVEIPDVWSQTWTARGRRRALAEAGFVSWQAVDEDRWTRADDLALRRAQHALGLPAHGLWTTAVAWAVHEAAG